MEHTVTEMVFATRLLEFAIATPVGLAILAVTKL
jgi:hypothetical protein